MAEEAHSPDTSQKAAAPAVPSVPAAATPKATEAPKPVAPPPAPAAEPSKAEVPKVGAPETDVKKDVFKELFGNEAKVEKGMAETAMKQQDDAKKGFFGKLKEAAPSAASKLEKPKERKIGRAMLQGSILLLILTAGFFFTQNAASFTWLGTNPAQRAEQAEEQVKTIQGEIHVQNHLAAILLLDQYSSLADEYFFSVEQSESDYVSSNKRKDYKETAEELQPELVALVKQIQEHVADSPSADEMEYARNAANEFIDALKAKEGDVDEQSLLQEVHDFETARKLMAKKDFTGMIRSLNADEATDEDLRNIYSDYTEVNASVTAVIAQIKSEKMNWSALLEDMEDIIKDVDPLFNTEFNGNLSITNIRFDRTGVDVNGESSTDDTKNFTLVSNLIDALNAHESFSHVEDRSFSKSNNDEDYVGTFRISMDLATNTEDDEG